MSARVCTPPVVHSGSSAMDLTRLGPGAESAFPDPAITPASRLRFFGTGFSPVSSSHRTSLSYSDPGLNFSRAKAVSRNLFGAPPPDTVQFARDKLHQILANDQKIWNFDFNRERSLPGRYHWERVSGSASLDSIPTSAYLFPTVPILSASPLPSSKSSKSNRTEAEPLFLVRPIPIPVSAEATPNSPTPRVSSSLGKEESGTTTSAIVRAPPPMPTFRSLTRRHSEERVSHTLPSNVLVRSSVELSEDESVRRKKYIRTDSSGRTKATQPKITAMYLPIKKRRPAPITSAQGKKTAL